MAERPTILFVEDSKFFASMIQNRIHEELDVNIVWKMTYKDAVEAIEADKGKFFAALLDLTLPDAPNGEIVEYCLKSGIPSIIFTGGLDNEQRSRFLAWNIVDYILKDSSTCIDTLLDTIKRIEANRRVKTMVVDDSKAMRDFVKQLLKTQLYTVVEASDGKEGLAVLAANPDIKVIITDYEMPQMDGFEFIKMLRETHSKNELAIIGISASGDPLLSARLIKSGANDFIPKPFQVEEFHCRINHAVEMLNNIELIRDLSYKDPLTALFNRRYFFENAEKFIKATERTGKSYCVAMLDIDHFKAVNDTYGHDGGDAVLRTIASIIVANVPDDSIPCRFGGEEFCILLPHDASQDPFILFDNLRLAIQATPADINGTAINVTVSAGICCESDDLQAMLKTADNRLYTAKKTGRNRVVAF